MPDLAPLTADPRPGTRTLERTILGRLGLQLMEVSGEQVVVRCAVADDVRDARGRFSLGALVVLAETAASTGAGLRAGEGRRAFGLEVDAAGFELPTGGVVTCSGECVADDGARQVWRMRITDAAGAVVGAARCTLAIVELAADAER